LATIVVGYTDTPEGNSALDAAISEAILREASIEVVHSRREGHDRDTAEIERYNELLEEIGSKLDAAGIAHRVHDYILGHKPPQDIIDCAENVGADLIVIGIRHRTKTGKYLLGSNAQDIILQAPCPVLAVKASETAI
jgi:nucleotide-binding universal stress UspA family protein